nr:MAG TPA: tail tape measure [Caudoviricetes sp.]
MFSDAIINIWLNVGDAKKQLDGLQGAFAKTADKIQNNFIAKLGGLALGGVGIKGLTNVYNEALKIQNLAESWNLPVEKVSAFTNAFSLLGGSTDDALNTVNSLQQAANQLSFHSSGPFRELSAVIRQNLFKKDYQGAIEAIRREYSRLSKEPGRNGQKELLNMLGIDNLPFMRMLKLTDAEYAEINKKAQEFGVLTEKASEALRGMEISLATISQAFQAIAYPVLEKLAPVLDKISAGMERVAFLSPEVKTGIVGILGAVTLLSPALKTAGFLFGSVFSFSTVGITAAAGAAYLLWQNWDKVSQAFKDYLAESPRLKDALEVVGEGFRAIGNGIKWLADNFNGWFPYFIDGINEILTFPKWLLSLFVKAQDGSQALGGALAGFVSGEGIMEGARIGMSHDAPNYQPSLTQTRINNAATNDNSRNVTVYVGSAVLPNVSDSRQFMRDMERMGNRGLPSVAQNNAGGVML